MNSTKEREKGLVQIQTVNYIDWQSTLQCVQSIKAQNYKHYRLIVIDNNSPNESLVKIREAYPNVFIISNSENVGWGAGLNRGFFTNDFETEPEFYLTLNSDTTLDPNCLTELIETMKANPKCAVTTPVIYEDHTRKKIHNVGFNLSYKYLLPLDWSRITGNHSRYLKRRLRKVTWTDDTVALMRREAIRKVGGYDEQYFMYGAVIDMEYELRQLDYDFLVNYNAIAYHKGKGSSGGKLSGFSLYYKMRNWCLFQKKYFSTAHLIFYTLPWSLLVTIIYFTKTLSQLEPTLILQMIRGIKDGFTCCSST